MLWSVLPLYAHEAWLAAQFPDPATLTDKQLLVQAGEAISTSCYDEPICATLDEAGRRFGIPELAYYAAIKRTQMVDSCDRKEKACIAALIAYSDRVNGRVSYESATLRRVQLQSTTDMQLWYNQVSTSRIGTDMRRRLKILSTILQIG